MVGSSVQGMSTLPLFTPDPDRRLDFPNGTSRLATRPLPLAPPHRDASLQFILRGRRRRHQQHPRPPQSPILSRGLIVHPDRS